MVRVQRISDRGERSRFLVPPSFPCYIVGATADRYYEQTIETIVDKIFLGFKVGTRTITKTVTKYDTRWFVKVIPSPDKTYFQQDTEIEFEAGINRDVTIQTNPSFASVAKSHRFWQMMTKTIVNSQFAIRNYYPMRERAFLNLEAIAFVDFP